MYIITSNFYFTTFKIRKKVFFFAKLQGLYEKVWNIVLTSSTLWVKFWAWRIIWQSVRLVPPCSTDVIAASAMNGNHTMNELVLENSKLFSNIDPRSLLSPSSIYTYISLSYEMNKYTNLIIFLLGPSLHLLNNYCACSDSKLWHKLTIITITDPYNPILA